MTRRFPPPWSVSETAGPLGSGSFVVRDATGSAVAYVYYDEGDPVRRSVTGHPSRDAGLRVARAIARLPVLLGVWIEEER